MNALAHQDFKDPGRDSRTSRCLATFSSTYYGDRTGGIQETRCLPTFSNEISRIWAPAPVLPMPLSLGITLFPHQAPPSGRR